MAAFLADLARSVSIPDGSPFRAVGLALGKGASALEVLVVTAAGKPTAKQIRTLWQARNSGRAAPLMVVVLNGGHVALCGPAGDEPLVYERVDLGQAERICREAIEQPDRHASLRALRDALTSIETPLPGVRNEGFLATHELTYGVPTSPEWREQWQASGERAHRLVGQRGEALLKGLGFNVERCDHATSILRTAGKGQKVAIAVLLQQSESPEISAERFSGLSPVSYALTVAGRENLPYVLVQQGAKLRLYPVKVGVGVGRRGRTETYIEIHTGLLRDTEAAWLWLLFSADALAEDGTLARLLGESRRFAGRLAEGLRDRIYEEVVPRLAEGLAQARGLKKPTAKDLAETYEMAMTVLFRLLFIAYGEDKNLLPYEWNDVYKGRSLKKKADDLLTLHRQHDPGPTPWDKSDSLWEEVSRLFRAVAEGHREWGVPAYGGGLFSREAEVSRIGALLADVSLPNSIMGPVLEHLLLIGTPEGLGPVDFRSLSVREFGTIYEGLLESELSVAETDLATDENGFYRPAKAKEEPVVEKNRIYLHNRSGARKSSGSYFTKEFAVEHLLDRALEPALAEHLARVDAMKDEDEAAAALFDFRVADIAMGSAHFLVAAVDRVERGLSSYLSRRNLPGVRHELNTLRASAQEALGNLGETIGDIEDTPLLRRLIARRCIYGVDLNPVAVHLARLSIWIHTFVPGLPLSLLDHNLVHGNALVGIGRVSEIEDLAREQNLPLFSLDVRAFVGGALEALERLKRINDATAADVKRARKAVSEALNAVRPAKALCDIVTACRMTGDVVPVDLEHWDNVKNKLFGSPAHVQAGQTLDDLAPLHFPVAFPEVFLRDRSGFDVILGNPPWQEEKVEEDEFWSRHEPGFKALTIQERSKLKATLRRGRPDLVGMFEEEVKHSTRMRTALLAGPYPGMGVGDADVYKAFCWRFWQLVLAAGGHFGVVLPRSAWVAKGSAEFRSVIFSSAAEADLCILVNRKEWVFPGVHEQNPIPVLNAITRAPNTKCRVLIRGPYRSFEEFSSGIKKAAAEFPGDTVSAWTETAALPLLPSPQSVEVFKVLRASGSLNADFPRMWKVRPLSEEIHSRKEQHLMRNGGKRNGDWPVYKGESFEIWNPDTGIYYGWAPPDTTIEYLHAKRRGGSRKSNSPFYEFNSIRGFFDSPATLPCMRPRIVIRRVSNRTNQRTVLVALAPPRVFVADQACCLLWPRGDESDVAYVLGVLSSLPLDWYARRFVETDVRLHVIKPLPIPRPARTSPLWQRAVALAGRLAAVDDRFAAWADAVGVDCGPLDAAEKNNRIHELDAVVARLYGLSERQLEHVFETFHEGWDYADRLKATLGFFRKLKG